MDRFRLYANLSTLANALVGVGAILYVLAGNKLWAMLLVVSGIGFDGLDGLFSRRSLQPHSTFGRVADSAADAVTFGLAPASLVAVHTDDVAQWSPYAEVALGIGLLVAVLAVTRLVLFTVRGHEFPYFVGAPTPQAALAIVAAGLFLDHPAFAEVKPIVFLLLVAAVAVLMVAPVPYPKIRRGHPLRAVATVTALGMVFALLPLQFHPAAGSPVYVLALVGAFVGAAGILVYYLYGPFTVRPVESRGAS